jgi:hypothetical protein
MALQIIMIALTIFTNMSLTVFFNQLWIFTIFIIVGLNAY